MSIKASDATDLTRKLRQQIRFMRKILTSAAPLSYEGALGNLTLVKAGATYDQDDYTDINQRRT